MHEGVHIRTMAMQASFVKQTFHFNFRVRTSRGSMSERDSWFIKIVDDENPECFGVGEAGPLAGLSKEFDETYEQNLKRLIDQFNGLRIELSQLDCDDVTKLARALFLKFSDLQKFPSIQFAFETALLDLSNGGSRLIFKNKFVEGHPISINGLIWMSGLDMMLQQIEIKIQEGFNCLKVKIGGLDFEKECDILQYVRRKYFKMDITLRLDANGAFKPEEAMYKLHQLSKFNIHSIEQPIKAGLPFLADLCKDSPIPIALDEELIGIHSIAEMSALLKRLRPQFLVLKPTLHGGLSGCKQWIEVAEELQIGWWVTSAMESNIGLNAIAQFTAAYNNQSPQGLGTGKIYEDNFDSPLQMKNGELSYQKSEKWVLPAFS